MVRRSSEGHAKLSTPSSRRTESVPQIVLVRTNAPLWRDAFQSAYIVMECSYGILPIIPAWRFDQYFRRRRKASLDLSPGGSALPGFYGPVSRSGNPVAVRTRLRFILIGCYLPYE